MGLVYTDLELSNPKEGTLRPIMVQALVDTGATTLCLPEHVAIQLKLEEIEKRDVTTADGKEHLVSYVGPIQVRFQNRTCFTGALVLGESVLMGAVPMEDMDLVIHPATHSITVNPKSPRPPQSRWLADFLMM